MSSRVSPSECPNLSERKVSIWESKGGKAKEREEDEVFVWAQVKCEGHTGLSTLISE